MRHRASENVGINEDFEIKDLVLIFPCPLNRPFTKQFACHGCREMGHRSTFMNSKSL